MGTHMNTMTMRTHLVPRTTTTANLFSSRHAGAFVVGFNHETREI